MRVSDFHFDLPEELIAQHPPAERGSSRMLVLRRHPGGETLSDEPFANLPKLLQPGDLLVLNDSRVLPARLFGRRVGRPTPPPQPAGPIEVLLTEQIGDPQRDSERPGENIWRALVKPARKARVGDALEFFEAVRETSHAVGIAPQPLLTAEVAAAGEFGERTLRFRPVEDFFGLLERAGHMPLPPYIRRRQVDAPDTAEDLARYQTVYSRQVGSAAAPTAGLHFTPPVLAALEARGVEIVYLTLHVGLGTFQPVRVDRVEDIRLHPERYTLPPPTAAALNRALGDGRRVIAVGTTTARTLEHIAMQAEARAEAGAAAGPEAGGRLMFHPHSGSTSIFLAPGHRFRAVSGLLTNFHLPQSTLLMLVSAFAAPPEGPDLQRGDQGRQTILAAYAHAIRQGYRFYSYGDCMLLL